MPFGRSNRLAYITSKDSFNENPNSYTRSKRVAYNTSRDSCDGNPNVNGRSNRLAYISSIDSFNDNLNVNGLFVNQTLLYRLFIRHSCNEWSSRLFGEGINEISLKML